MGLREDGENSVMGCCMTGYPSSDMIRVIEQRRMRRARHVTRTGEKKNTHRILWANVNEIAHIEDT